jgi:nucleoside-diphosphate-sugar epimerase
MIGNSKNILITGVTGFLGSGIARELIGKGYSVYATRRNSSLFGKCSDIFDKITWINIDNNDWEAAVREIPLNMLIHSAWSGVKANARNDWDIQLGNFNFSKKIIDLALGQGVKKIIVLGSQAEYGLYSDKIKEDTMPAPVDAYGSVKLLTQYYLKIAAEQHNVNWFWLRVFSVFGPGENEDWLLPFVIKKLLGNEAVELTEGTQEYDYLYIRDFNSKINEVIESQKGASGIYNICSGNTVKLRDLLLDVAKCMGVSENLLLFGKKNYRINQNMCIAGSNQKYENVFGKIKCHFLLDAVMETINFYKCERDIE